MNQVITIDMLDRLQSDPATAIVCPRNPKDHGRLGVRVDLKLVCGGKGCSVIADAPRLNADLTGYEK